MKIEIDDLTGSEVIELLRFHRAEMERVTPQAESMHALDLDGLRHPDVVFWTLRDEGRLAGCGAVKRLDETHGEIKSMRTAEAYQRRGVAATLLAHIEQESAHMGLARLSLETGTEDYFAPARALYERCGFAYCEPFAGYVLDPLSAFMTKKIA